MTCRYTRPVNGSAVSGMPARQQPLDLGHDAARELRVDAAGDALRDRLGGRIQHEAGDLVLRERRGRSPRSDP